MVNNYIKWHYKANAENNFNILSNFWNNHLFRYSLECKCKTKPTSQQKNKDCTLLTYNCYDES